MTIRRQPEDFVVVERLRHGTLAALDPERGERSPHAWYELTKTSLTTPDAVRYLARALGVRHAAVAAGGLKDRHAKTAQYVSVNAADIPAGASLPEQASDRNWSARRVGWSAAPVDGESVIGNGFTIVVRDLAREAAHEMGRRMHLLTLPEEARGEGGERTLLVMNYFGDQRFGSARHGLGWVARHLMKGEFEEALRLAIGTPARKDTGKTRQFTRLLAGRWGEWEALARELPRCPERKPIEVLAGGGDFREAFAAIPYFTQQMCVEAYQSHLWNATALRLARRIVRMDQEREGLLLKSTGQFGEMHFPAAETVKAAWREIDLPLLAWQTELAEPWDESAADVLHEEGIALGDLRIPGLRRPFFGEASRALFARATGFRLSAPEPDELVPAARGRVKRTLSFDLPRGAYATVVLRALGQ